MKLFILLFSFSLHSYPVTSEENLIAVNVALEAQGPVLEFSKVKNKQIKYNNQTSFSFDNTHIPHVTIIQMFIDSKDIKRLASVVEKNLPRVVLLEASDIEFSEIYKDDSLKLVNQNFKANNELTFFQTNLFKKIEDFKKNRGTSSAFYKKSEVDSQFLDYVSSYQVKNAGLNYTPHISLGVSKGKLEIKPLTQAMFSKIGIYQIGQFGTARKKLYNFDLK
jgi:hypothetical protein